MGDFTMPSLGADMDRGTLSEWLVAEGDQVHKGDIVAVIETDKSDVEVEVFETGVIESLLVQPGTEVAVGAPLARILAEGEAEVPTPGPAPKPASTQKPKTARKSRAKSKTAAKVVPAPEPPHGGGGPKQQASLVLSPLVRHLAEELHVDVTSVAGTGPGGRVTRADVAAASAPTTPRNRPTASPYARRRAAELGTDWSHLAGSGPDGAVLARDLVGAPPVAGSDATRAAPATPGAEARPIRRADRQQTMRQAIARLMTTANQEIPHYHVMSSIDMHDALAWLDHHTATHPPAERILPAALLLRATASAAVAVPELNGWWRADGFEPASSVDIGVAVSLRGGGLVTPTIGSVDQLDLAATMAALRDLVTRARRGRLRGADLAEASITVTNLGEQGAESVLGLIHPPQVALVGFGRVVDQVCAVDGMVAVRPRVTATLSGDHRATDGHAGSRFLAAVASALEQPDQL